VGSRTYGPSSPDSATPAPRPGRAWPSPSPAGPCGP
jgi:hypothetical protein